MSMLLSLGCKVEQLSPCCKARLQKPLQPGKRSGGAGDPTTSTVNEEIRSQHRKDEQGEKWMDHFETC